MPRVVLDANVFVRAAVQPKGPSGRLIESFLAEAALEIVASPAIAAEIAGSLEYPRVRAAIRGRIDAHLWLDRIFFLADEVEDGDLPGPVSEDPGDDKYLHAALAGRAAFLATEDRRLLDLVEHEGVLIVRPGTFLDLLGR